MTSPTNAQIAASRDLWMDYYDVHGTTPFDSLTLDQRLAMLNQDYPETDPGEGLPLAD